MRTLQLDWETEQKRSMSYFNQVMELEKERDQVSMCSGSESILGSWLTCPKQFNDLTQCIRAYLYLVVLQLSLAVCIFYTMQTSFLCLFLPLQALRSRDSLQLEYTDCLLDKNRLRKRIAELQANLEQQYRELERERERSREKMDQSSSCLHCVS